MSRPSAQIRRRERVAVALVVGLLGACGSSAATTPATIAAVSTSPSTSAPSVSSTSAVPVSSAAAVTSTAVAATTLPATSVASTTTPAPATFREAATRRLTHELGDAALADQLVAGFSADTMTQLEARVGIDGAATSLLLAIAPPTMPASEVGSLVVFAFGNRTAADGSLQPGPVNEALAATTAKFVAQHPVPVFAQWEVADLLVARGTPGVVSVGRDVDATGKVTYLSTAGVAAKAMTLAAAAGTSMGHVGVVGFADHAVRCVMTARAAGMTADVPEGLQLPSTYDPESGQPWTRDRLTYLGVDLAARLALAG